MTIEQQPTRRTSWLLPLGVLALAGAWRFVVAAMLPVIARDSVTFCWYARELGRQGLLYLRSPDAQQHPLFPAMILAVHSTARALGAPDTPLTWQVSGQLVAWLAGMLVVVLSGLLAARLIERLRLPLSAPRTVLFAMLLAALLDYNVWLSAEAMSDQVHLVFYLSAVWLLLRLERWPAALACGLCSGLAFLTRQEGIVPAAAALLVVAWQRRRGTWPRGWGLATAVLVGFLVCAGPYWEYTGRFSSKKDPSEWFQNEPSAAARRLESTLAARDGEPDGRPAIAAPVLAKLEIHKPTWYALLPQALYRLFRTGRVVVPLLALLPLIHLRKRLLEVALIGWTTCLAGHLGLTLILLEHYGYLDPRHMLVPVMLLAPLAAMLLGRVYQLLIERRHRAVAILVVLVCLLPLAVYSLRIPNSKDRFLRDAAGWLTAHETDLSGQRLLSGSSGKRIAFYADMPWERWPEEAEDVAGLRAQIRGGGPGYFAIEVGPAGAAAGHFERRGNRELMATLLADPEMAARLRLVHVEPARDRGAVLELYEMRPAGTAASRPGNSQPANSGPGPH